MDISERFLSILLRFLSGNDCSAILASLTSFPSLKRLSSHPGRMTPFRNLQSSGMCHFASIFISVAPIHKNDA